MVMVRDDEDVVKPYRPDKLTWKEVDADHVELSGTFDGAPTTVRLRKIDYQKMPIFTRGFHWINEYPYNR